MRTWTGERGRVDLAAIEGGLATIRGEIERGEFEAGPRHLGG